MDPLDRHKSRVERLQTSLDRLMALHAQVHDLQGEIVAMATSDAPDRFDHIEGLRKKVQALRPEIERAKRELRDRGE
jgi:hypothetical protein